MVCALFQRGESCRRPPARLNRDFPDGHKRRHSSDDIQIRENRTTIPSPWEMQPFGTIRWIDFGLPHRLGVVALFVCSFTGVGLASRAIPNAALLQETIAVSGWHGGVRLSASLGATIDGACL